MQSAISLEQQDFPWPELGQELDRLAGALQMNSRSDRSIECDLTRLMDNPANSPLTRAAAARLLSMVQD